RAAGDGGERPHHRAQLRQGDRGRRAEGSRAAPGRGRRLPGERDVSEAPLLEVRDLHVAYGHVHAVRGISRSVRRGQIVTLIGPNGAGKSSTLNAVAGLFRPARGAVLLEGKPVTGMPAHRAARKGVVLVPEGRGMLQRMTVEENLRLAAELHPGPGIDGRIEEQLRRLPSLGRRRRVPAGQMSGGEDQLLAIARAWLRAHRVLLLGGPSLDLATWLVRIATVATSAST